MGESASSTETLTYWRIAGYRHWGHLPFGFMGITVRPRLRCLRDGRLDDGRLHNRTGHEQAVYRWR